MAGNSIDARCVSVVIPAYNAAAFLPACLQSVFGQNSPPGEVIVVDDGSTDATAAISRSFGATVITVPNAGPSAARNTGTRAAGGEYIAFLDADDIWHERKLAVQLSALRRYGQPAFSFTDYRMFDEDGPRRTKSQLRSHAAFRRIARRRFGRGDFLIAARGTRPVLYDSYIPPSAVMARKADIQAVGGFDEVLRVTEDFEFFLRMFRRFPAIAVMQPLLMYRQHAAQATASATAAKAGFFAVAQKVAAEPDRYPAGDVRYLARTGHLRHLRVAVQQARGGEFAGASESFRRSLTERPTIRAAVGLVGARLCADGPGRATFDGARRLWRSRPGRR